MSARIDVTAQERHVVRVFAVDLSPAELRVFGARNGTWPLADALGVDTLQADQLELFAISDLEGVGLTGYLEDGIGISPDALQDMRPQLEAITQATLVIRSQAFNGDAVTLRPKAPLRLVATFTEETAPVQFDKLPSASAEGTFGPSGPAPQSGPKRRWWPVAMMVIGVLIIIAALVQA